MTVLRLTQYAESEVTRYRVEIALEGDGPRQTAQVSFDYQLSEKDRENIRWYLEEYLQYPHDPAPQIATIVENRMAEIGVELFKAIFQSNDDARDLWAITRQKLNNIRVEILTDVGHATNIPWELIRDPKTDTPLALRAPAFVRIHSQAVQQPKLPDTAGEPIRILLVICRPKGRFDVPFRSVASRILKGLGNRSDSFQLDVLRPPMFESLSRKLRQAKATGKPYHVVHFDGHGVYGDSKQITLQNNPLIFRDHRPGMHGYLAFENSANEDNVEFVNGPKLGRLLVETDVPVLILNACRSAHAEPQYSPVQVNENAGHAKDLHAHIRAFGSIAQEIIDAGVAGVVAMRYNVYVMTAAQFVTDLYASLMQGQTLGEAVTLGRKQLDVQPYREISFNPIALQDWSVPVVYEAAPIALFSKPTKPIELKIKLNANDAFPSSGWIDPQLPKSPDTGFYGRDETLLSIDRAFDQHSTVLLHAFAGSGKTSTAAEFGRWYTLTGGITGPVLFTSFERYLPLSKVIDKIGQVFRQELEQSGIRWLTLDDTQRREVALQVLSQLPILWIWDNIEPVAGFPDGATERWSTAEQQQLVDFIRDCRETKSKFLLTSRREEKEWLGSIPCRIRMPPMPMPERIQLTQALSRKHGHRLIDSENWRTLLEFTQGNPLTITVVIGQALRNGYKDKKQIEAFVADLNAGKAKLESNENDGRDNSLIASLNYGFEFGFNENDLRRLALLYLFRQYVDVDIFRSVVNYCSEVTLSDSRDFSEEDGIALLSKAAEIGILQKKEIRVVDYFGNNESLYEIHPALPQHFDNLFRQYYCSIEDKPDQSVINNFIESVSNFAESFEHMYFIGIKNVIGSFKIQEENLLAAVRLSCQNQKWIPLENLLRNLQHFYQSVERKTDWSMPLT